jgi:beta-lactamase regulating signal transducer with metallopeptidase domain
MIPSEFIVLFEATLRALIAAVAVWAALRILRVKNVPAQKAAWGLMLIAAMAMPLLMRWQLVPAWAAVNLPVSSLPKFTASAPVVAQLSRPAPISAASSPGKLETLAQSNLEAREDFPAPARHIRSDRGARSAVEVRSADRAHSAPVNQIGPAASSPPLAQSPAGPATQPATGCAAQIAAQIGLLSTTGRVLAIAWTLYLGVCAALLFRLSWGLASSLRIWMNAKPVATLTNFDLPDSIHVRSSDRIGSPVNIGSGILLPADYAEWDEEKLRVVVAHERSHVTQRDFYLQMIAGLYASLTWFSPLGWWLKRKLSELGEAISDRAGLDAASSPSAYAQLLLEFAAQPRPTLVTGVAMAHSRNLSNRIERLLNDSSFRLAFSGGRRALLALALPVALIAATAMVRVDAAQAPQSAATTAPSMQSPDQAPAAPASPAPSAGQSSNTMAAVLFSGQSSDQAPAPPQPGPAPAAAPSPDAAPAAAPSASPASEPAPVPPMPPGGSYEYNRVVVAPPIPPIDVNIGAVKIPTMKLELKGFEGHAFCFADGDAYAIVGDAGTNTRFCGNTGGEMEAEVEKARSVAHGHFLLFRHDGKYYIVDDPATVGQIEDMNKAMQDQGEKMRALGEQYRDAGRDVREQARKERETAANIPAPDLSKEMAELNASVASLTAKQGAVVPREELQQVQREISEIQRRLIESEVKVDVNIDMSKFNAEMGKFNEQMSKMGAEMGRIADENHEKMGSIIDDSLKNGKARPVN